LFGCIYAKTNFLSNARASCSPELMVLLKCFARSMITPMRSICQVPMEWVPVSMCLISLHYLDWKSRGRLFLKGGGWYAHVSVVDHINHIAGLTTTPTGPITHSWAKKIQQEVHALLCELKLNSNDNFVLPKSCMLILLRFTQEATPSSYMKNTDDQQERISQRTRAATADQFGVKTDQMKKRP
jgi:hypothetical protein